MLVISSFSAAAAAAVSDTGLILRLPRCHRCSCPTRNLQHDSTRIPRTGRSHISCHAEARRERRTILCCAEKLSSNDRSRQTVCSRRAFRCRGSGGRRQSRPTSAGPRTHRQAVGSGDYGVVAIAASPAEWIQATSGHGPGKALRASAPDEHPAPHGLEGRLGRAEPRESCVGPGRRLLIPLREPSRGPRPASGEAAAAAVRGCPRGPNVASRGGTPRRDAGIQARITTGSGCWVGGGDSLNQERPTSGRGRPQC
jgi:hypothetical protein